MSALAGLSARRSNSTLNKKGFIPSTQFPFWPPLYLQCSLVQRIARLTGLVDGVPATDNLVSFLGRGCSELRHAGLAYRKCCFRFFPWSLALQLRQGFSRGPSCDIDSPCREVRHPHAEYADIRRTFLSSLFNCVSSSFIFEQPMD